MGYGNWLGIAHSIFDTPLGGMRFCCFFGYQFSLNGWFVSFGGIVMFHFTKVNFYFSADVFHLKAFRVGTFGDFVVQYKIHSFVKS